MKINGKKIRLTKKLSWHWCMKQWNFVARYLENNSACNVADAKNEFLDNYKITDILLDCFFCEYVEQQDSWRLDTCYLKCPGAEADKHKKHDTLWCQQDGKCWCDNPQEFHKNLKRLYKKLK
jgi:hypothetical protein